MNDSEQAALVDELAEAMENADGWFIAEYIDLARACLPIIERLLAERDLDRLLDSVGAVKSVYSVFQESIVDYRSEVYVLEGDKYTIYEGIAGSHSDALRDAVAKAKAKGVGNE